MLLLCSMSREQAKSSIAERRRCASRLRRRLPKRRYAGHHVIYQVEVKHETECPSLQARLNITTPALSQAMKARIASLQPKAKPTSLDPAEASEREGIKMTADASIRCIEETVILKIKRHEEK